LEAQDKGEIEVNYDLVIDAPNGAELKAQKSVKKEIRISTSLSSVLGEVLNSLHDEIAFYEKQALEHGLPSFTKPPESSSGDDVVPQ
jgi:hypothetical protein